MSFERIWVIEALGWEVSRFNATDTMMNLGRHEHHIHHENFMGIMATMNIMEAMKTPWAS